MNAQLEQLAGKLEGWMTEPMRPMQEEIVIVANLLRETVHNLKLVDARLERVERNLRSVANTASCLANGIQPD